MATRLIITHEYSDLDALLGAFLVGEFLCGGDYEVRFMPANTELASIEEPFDFAVDFGKHYDPERGLFDHHQVFEFESAVSLIHRYIEERGIETRLNEVVEYVHWQDLSGNAVRHFAGGKLIPVETMSMHNVLAALRDAGKTDHEIFAFFRTIMLALIKRRDKWLAAKQNLDRVCTFYNDWIAIIKDGTGSETPYIWETIPEIKIVIYQDGNNVGAIRRDGETIDLKRLEPRIDEKGWFYHLSGFIAAHGTRKAMSRKKSRHTPEDLAAMVVELFEAELFPRV